MSEHREPIPSMIYNSAVGGHVTNSQQIIDENLNREQNDINQETVGAVPYNSTTPNGMGRIVLKKTDNFKEVVEAQTNGNTIFVIKYDFTLTGNVTIPANCILKFEGGSIANSIGNSYTIDGNNGSFNQDVTYKIFNNVIFKNFAIDYIDIRWFGAKPSKAIEFATEDSAPYFQKAMDMCEYYQCIPIKVIGIYLIDSTVTCINHFQLYGNNYVTKQFSNNIAQTPESLICVKKDITVFDISGISPSQDSSAYCSFNIHNIKFVGPSLSGTSAILFNITTSDYPGRPSSIKQCEICNFKYAINFAFIGSVGTMLCNLTISDCNVNSCNSFIYTEDVNYMTVQNLHVYDNVIEACTGNAIVLCNPASYVHIENNLMESNNGYNLYIEKAIKQCHIEINGNYFEDQDKFVYIHTTGDEAQIISLNSHDNYFYKSNGYSIIDLDRVYVISLDNFIYYKTGSKFKHCWFDKKINLSDFPIAYLEDYNWFDELENTVGCPYISLRLTPSEYVVENNEIVCRKDIFGTTTLNSNYERVCQGTIEGDKCLFIVKADATNSAFNFSTIYGTTQSNFKYSLLEKPGYLVVVAEFPNTENTYLACTCYMSTNNQKAYFGTSVTTVELRKYPNVKVVSDLCCAKNLVDTSIGFATNGKRGQINCFDGINKKPIYWNGINDRWEDMLGNPISTNYQTT